MVGGHCIPVDPYYLVYKAKELGYHPQVVLAGRSVNDSMSKHVALLTIKGLNRAEKVIKNSKVLIMGLTYKENTSDTRESPVKDIIKELKEFGIDLYGYDPMLKKEKIENFGVKAFNDFNVKIDCTIVTVLHDEFKKMTLETIEKFMNNNPVLIDVRGYFDRIKAEEKNFIYKSL